MIFPWDRITIYNIRLQQVSHVYDVLTSDGLDVKAEITIRFRPIGEDLGNAPVARKPSPEVSEDLGIVTAEGPLGTDPHCSYLAGGGGR